MRSNPVRAALILLIVAGAAAVWILAKGKLTVAQARMLASGYCLLMTVCGFFIWQHAFRRYRDIANAPTSRIGTAAQGYVEIHGTASAAEETRPVTGISQAPCLWYRYEIAQRGSFNSRSLTPFSFVYTPVETRVSETHFAVRDATGAAVIFPHGSEVICAHKEIWYSDTTRYTEERIVEGDPLYVLGHFTTSHRQFNVQLALHCRLEKWQRNRSEVLRRFDANKNGVIDYEEMEAMKRAAEAEVEAQRLAEREGEEVHVLIQPEGGQAFLLSTKPETDLQGHYFFWHVVGLVFFFTGLAGFGVWALKDLMRVLPH